MGEYKSLEDQRFGKFQFIDYGREKDSISDGLKKLVNQFTKDNFATCDGERAAMILYGGSGAGKTKNTEAIMGELDNIFDESYKIKMSITEVVPVTDPQSSVVIGTIDLSREGKSDSCRVASKAKESPCDREFKGTKKE